MRPFLALLPLAGVVALPCVEAAQDGDTDGRVRVELPLKTARSRDPVLGGARDKVFVAVWLPDGVKAVRGAVCNPFSKDEPVSKHWRAACRHWGFAYVQVDFDAVNKQEFGLLATGLGELAKTTGRPELATVPLFFTGMSRGGGMSMNLAELMPERTIAAVPVCLEVGPASAATRAVPVLTVFGEKDGSQMDKLLAKLPAERKESARFGIAVQWGRKHEFGQANNLSFVFLDEVIAKRLPREPGGKLGEIALEDGWLGDVATWKADGTRPTIAAWKDHGGERDKAAWFPSRRVAATWQAFVSGTKDVTIAEPAGLGDGQAFALHSAAKPVAVKLALAEKLKPEKVELYDGDVRLAEKAAPWTFDVPLKPGVHSLIAVVHQAGQPPRGSRPHTIVVGE